VLSLIVPSAASSAPANSIDYTIRGTRGTHGWYVSNVTVNWVISPPPDSSTGCDAVTLTTEGTTNLLCSATWSGGAHFDYPLAISIDKTAPVVHGVPGRAPDANGWYDKPVTIAFAGTDATSGIAGCSSTPYGGPDSGTATVTGTCTDIAGKVGSAAYTFAYDATPPTLGKVGMKHGNRSVLLSWAASPDTQVTQVARSPGKHGARTTIVYQGAGKTVRDKGLRVGAKYTYTVTAFDPASNTAAKTLAVTATGRLINPVPGEHVTSPPRLAWLPVKGASYYNVLLIHGGTIFSAWPSHTYLKLPRSWTYKGRHHRLEPGVYRWYVWPGFGPLAQAHYGRLLGRSSFAVPR